MDRPGASTNVRSPMYDRKNSYMPHGIASAGGADNAYAANMMNSGTLEDEETHVAAKRFKEFCEELRERGFDHIANELAILIAEVLE